MCVFYSFRLGGCPAGVGQSNQVVLVLGLRLKTIPLAIAILSIVFQTFCDRFIEWTAQLAFCGVCVCIDDERYVRVNFSITVKEREEFSVDDDCVCISMVEDVRDIFMLQPIIDRYEMNVRVCGRPSAIWIIPTLTDPAAAMPNIDSRNAGVLGQSMPTLLY